MAFFLSSSSCFGNRPTISFSFCLSLSPRATWQHLSLTMPSAIRRASWPRAPSLFIASLSWLYTLERKEDFCGTKPMGKTSLSSGAFQIRRRPTGPTGVRRRSGSAIRILEPLLSPLFFFRMYVCVCVCQYVSWIFLLRACFEQDR